MGSLDNLLKTGKLVSAAEQFWVEVAAFHRRTLCYLLERLVMSTEQSAGQIGHLPDSDFGSNIDEDIPSRAKCLFSFASLVDQNRLPMTGLRLQVTETNESSFLIISAENPIDIEEFGQRVDFHRDDGYRFYDESHFENDFVIHAQFLDASVEEDDRRDLCSIHCCSIFCHK